MAKISLGLKSEYLEGKIKLIDLEYDSIAVFKNNGKFYAYLDICPHADTPMGEDCMSNGEIICPLHGAKFKAISGEVIEAPAEENLEMYDVFEENDELFIEMD